MPGRTPVLYLFIPVLVYVAISCGNRQENNRNAISPEIQDTIAVRADIIESGNELLVLPEVPRPGNEFRILAVGGKEISDAKIIVTGLSGTIESGKNRTVHEMSYWRLENFSGLPEGRYKASLIIGKKTTGELDFEISQAGRPEKTDKIWQTLRGWDSATEEIYSAWLSSLFYGSTEQSSWPSLHEVTQDRDCNFLFNYLSLGEDDPESKNKVIMQPDCADNPFFLRAYFSWKMGLPFGYHVCDRGSLNHDPGTGIWITNETRSTITNRVQAFNSFLRKVMDGVHSGSARTSLDNENSDYYPVSLESSSLRPGTVYADPYGHTLVIIDRVKQKRDKPGLLLAVDAQPDGTIGIKRFWKGNFLFNTSEVIGEPGFKVFRPIQFKSGVISPMSNNELMVSSGFIPFSLQQRDMKMDVFYNTMERIINPEPLDPEAKLTDLINALHEQLLVRVMSVSNGEEYMKKHPGSVIEMPHSATGIFQAGGLWENYSTPNRDLRLLIAIDAVLDFPDAVAQSPRDYKISNPDSAEIKKRLLSLLERKALELLISYTRTDGSEQKISVGDILKRKEAFEMAYNPNDAIEIRWGAPVNSGERSTCRRQASADQYQTMLSTRKWFQKR
ncbi:MAG: hypothetical protein MUF36_12710, partial [Bacteroidales bacterium]|nr:hypothetical protein [Bacteroidales bacterium]